MKILPYSPGLLPALAEMINAYVVQVPPGWALAENQVEAILSAPSRLWQVHYPDEIPPFENETLCAISGGRLVAALQWGRPFVSPEMGTQPMDAILYWAFSLPEESRAIQILLRVVSDRARAAGYRKMSTTRFAFGIGWMGISLTWPHIVEAFRKAGFVAFRHWVLYKREGLPPDPPPPPLLSSLRLETRPNPTVLEWEVELWDGETLAAECHVWGIPPPINVRREAVEWATIEWLGVEPAYRRQGLGRWLLCESLRRQVARGVAHYLCWTVNHNIPVRCLNESADFQAVGECIENEILLN